MKDLIFVRHGILSNDENMAVLEVLLRRRGYDGFDVRVDNQRYGWRDPVIDSGLKLADDVIKLCGEEPPRNVFLVGHSQGGLVCRVAAIALAGVRRKTREGTAGSQHIEAWRHEHRALAQRVAERLTGVVTLATPNAGALTYGQLSIAGRAVQATLRTVLPWIPRLGVRDLDDLATDRLFRTFQHYSVPRVRYLSVSGSWINRYSAINHQDLEAVPYIGRLGIRLEQPNDGVVEDESVDMREAPLPPEIENLEAQYEHIRSYLDCTSITHFNIHECSEVAGLVRRRFHMWALAAARAQEQPA